MSLENTYNSLKNSLIETNQSLSALIDEISTSTDISDSRFDGWGSACASIREQVEEEVVRVAVIGSIKSGKSTLVNSLFKGDHLKRGAGVVTSIVTRIRSGSSLMATLYFKSWEEVNTEIERALVLFPSWSRKKDSNSFDIRQAEDRLELRAALDGLSRDVLVNDGEVNADSVLLDNYLKGYDNIQKMISEDGNVKSFSARTFKKHHLFVGEDAHAVYLKDIELEISNDSLDRTIEIADCQGSDSPNPRHMAMIQEYMLRAHFIVYAISSRTGLRQADVHFLSLLKNMGILSNILFVVNTDIGEHDCLEDLQVLISKIHNELSMIVPNPDLYAFSALYNLFCSIPKKLTKRDALRREHWKAVEDIVAFSNSETDRFQFSLNEKLTRERFALLLRNHLERMTVITSGVKRWTSINRELLEKDDTAASKAIKKIEHYQQRMQRVKALISSTLSGAEKAAMLENKTAIDHFFGLNSGELAKQTLEFVRNYSLSVEKYRNKLETSGFSNTLYIIFQDFKRSLDSFMAKTVHPEIARFAGEMELNIKGKFEAVAYPFYSMASDDIEEIRETITAPPAPDSLGLERGLLDLDSLKRKAGLSLPSSDTALRYTVKTRTETIMRLGIHSIRKLVNKVLKKSEADEKDDQLKALTDGIVIIKKETEESIIFHLENYRENLKFQYIARLIETSSQYLHNILNERFQAYDSDIKVLEKVITKKGSERESLIEFLNSAGIKADELSGKLQECIRMVETPEPDDQ
ncbi:MAG: dynamin family protein [Nitrospira sp.]|nr:dynamin family protein [bacterium]MBL7048242.1 dynamin family protein [Nitrospira sp.]